MSKLKRLAASAALGGSLVLGACGSSANNHDMSSTPSPTTSSAPSSSPAATLTIAFGALGWFYRQVLPGWLGLLTTTAGFSVGAITASVLVFLGIPLAAGFLARTIGEKTHGRDWYESTVLPSIGPWALYGVLFTIRHFPPSTSSTRQEVRS